MKERLKKIFFRLICLIVIIFIIYQIIYYSQLDLFYKTDYSEYVEKYSKIYSVDEKLIYAVIKNESNFNADAVSKVGAKGLMQIMESTADDVAEELNIKDYDLFSPDDNIKIGTKYLAYLLDKYGEITLALAAYNAGFGTVDTWISQGVLQPDGKNYENIPYKETNMYVRKILRDYDVYINKFS